MKMKFYKYNINELKAEEYNVYYSKMSEQKKRRVDKFRFDDDKKRTVVGDALVKKAVAQWCGVSEQDVAFEYSQNGKPHAVGLSVEFNISHSEDIVVCAVSDKPVGIDIEKIKPIDITVAKRVCSEEELCYLFSHTPLESDFVYTEDVEILTRFYKLWTAKEAYVKCSGKGIGGGLYHTPKCETVRFDDYIVSIYEQE